MFTVMFYGLVLFGVLIALIGMLGKVRAYWLAGLFLYVASFLGSFSIGSYLLVLPFILWSLALAHTFRLIKKPFDHALYAGGGMILWFLAISTVDDYWLFFPISWLFS